MPEWRSFAYAAAAAAAVGCSGPAGASPGPDVDTEGCRVIRLTADGQRVETPPQGVRRGSPGTASASVSSAGGGSRSTVSVSSSSQGGGTARSTASATDAQGRTTTTTHDQDGCTVIIDERNVRGG